ncbi:MAG: TolC family protein [Bacteroidetes bacterium]|nr:TolC family protein [Bacteroidota bacterium]
MRKITILTMLCCFTTFSATAQHKWTLEECINYAQENNISVQQNNLKVEDNELSLKTAKYSRLPDLNASLGGNMNFGRSPSRDGIYTDNNQLSGSGNLNASLPVFNGMRIKHQINQGKLNLQASLEDYSKAKEDVALNVTSLYLQVLYSKELIKVAEEQVLISKKTVNKTKAKNASGKVPLSTVYESEAILAKDEMNLINQKNNHMLALLNLSQALNKDSEVNFDISEPNFNKDNLDKITTIKTINDIYNIALSGRPHVKAEEYRLESSKKSILISKSYLYPSMTLTGGYGNNVYRSYATGASNSSLWTQLSNNGSEFIGASINIPIFNRTATRNQIKSSQLATLSQMLTVTDVKRNLRKEIEQAYYNAVASVSQYVSAKKALKSAKIAYNSEKEKAEAGRSTMYDFDEAKNKMVVTESEVVQAKYEFIFRHKILDYYQGIPLTL